jgi:hypothetical protein
LGVASVGILVVWAQVRVSPSETQFFGLKVQGIPDNWLLPALGLVVIYFLIAFVIYATSDLVGWGFAVADARSKKEVEDYQHELEQRKNSKLEDEENRNKRKDYWADAGRFADHQRNAERYKIVQVAKEKRQSYYRPALIISLVRAGFDFLLPLIVGIYAVRLLLFP